MSTSGTGSLSPLQPIVNAGLSYQSGGALAWLTTTTMTVASGQVRDSTNTTDILLGGNFYLSGAEAGLSTASAAVTINTALTGAGGVDTGGGTSITASTLYAVYVIGDSKGFSTASAMLSKSFSSPQLPLGYDCFRRVGAVAMDASKHILQFVQSGKRMYYDVPVAPASVTAGSATLATIGTITRLVPAIAGVDVLVGVSLTPNSAGNSLFLAPYGASASGNYAQTSAEVTAHAQLATLICPAGLNSGAPEVDYISSSASDTVAFLVQGYIDQF